MTTSWGVSLFLDPYEETFNKKAIHRLCALHDIKLVELSIVVDVHRDTVYAWSSGKRKPRHWNLHKLRMLADATNYNLSQSPMQVRLLPQHQLAYTYPWDEEDRKRGAIAEWLKEMERLRKIEVLQQEGLSKPPPPPAASQ